MDVFKKSLSEYKAKIDAMLGCGFCRDYLKRYVVVGGMDSYVDLFLKYCEGGKRLRAWLVNFGYEMVAGGTDGRAELTSLSCEVFQTGILAQDDVFDRSPVRRFKPSMYMALGGDRTAESETVCLGDIAIVLSNTFISNSGFGPERVAKALDFQNRAVVATIAGEIKDIALGAGPEHGEAEVLEVARLKTAYYTITGPLSLGAILAGAPDALLEKIAVFGADLGISFQIKDDIIGMFGDEKTIGKSVLSDAREGKKTVLTCHFTRNSAAPQLEFFNKTYGSEDITEDDLAKLREYMEAAGSLAYAEEMCREYAAKARAALAGMGLSEASARLLDGFIDYLVARNA
jgi:geranylgeranyl pyrophosphate synthase